jgi:hypothetical protein
MKIVTLFFSLTLFPLISFGQNTTEGLTNEFFRKYESNTDSAFDFIFGTNKWMGENKDGTEKVKFQIREYANLMGEYIGYEKLTDRSLGESLNVAVYLVKYKRQPLRFIFKYYKAENDWMLYNFKFDESIDDDLDEIMKYDYLNGN